MSNEALIAKLREEATHDLHHETIALLNEAAKALASESKEQPAQPQQELEKAKAAIYNASADIRRIQQIIMRQS